MAKDFVNKGMTAYNERAAALKARREGALSAFRSTAEELESINESLTEEATDAELIIQFYEAAKESAAKAKADNAAVIQKIYDIIGK